MEAKPLLGRRSRGELCGEVTHTHMNGQLPTLAGGAPDTPVLAVRTELAVGFKGTSPFSLLLEPRTAVPCTHHREMTCLRPPPCRPHLDSNGISTSPQLKNDLGGPPAVRGPTTLLTREGVPRRFSRLRGLSHGGHQKH